MCLCLCVFVLHCRDDLSGRVFSSSCSDNLTFYIVRKNRFGPNVSIAQPRLETQILGCSHVQTPNSSYSHLKPHVLFWYTGHNYSCALTITCLFSSSNGSFPLVNWWRGEFCLSSF